MEILSWDYLGSAAGVAATVTILTQILKNYIQKVDPKWIALVLALIITIIGQIVMRDFTLGTLVLSIVNAIMATGVAIGAYEGIINPLNNKGGI